MRKLRHRKEGILVQPSASEEARDRSLVKYILCSANISQTVPKMGNIFLQHQGLSCSQVSVRPMDSSERDTTDETTQGWIQARGDGKAQLSWTNGKRAILRDRKGGKVQE